MPSTKCSTSSTNRPKAADAGDVAVELVADLVGHEADLLPLHELALGIVGAPLHLGGVPRDLRQVFARAPRARLVDARVPDSRSDAVHDEVGVPADRRREVRVVAAARPKCPRFAGSYRAFCIVRSIRNAMGRLLGRAANLLDQPLKMPRPERLAGAASE